MISFKQFLKEDDGNSNFLTEEALKITTVKTAERAAQIIKEHCSQSIWMLKAGKYLWRGDTGFQKTYKSKDYAATVIDTSSSKRSSRNTSNHYTTILDNNPLMKEFPKRSKGLICTTRHEKANDYAPFDVGPLAIFPFDDAKLGFTNVDDIWGAKIKAFGNDYSLVTLNDIWYIFGITGAFIENFEDFAKAIKDKKSKEYKKFSDWLWHNAGYDSDRELEEILEAWTSDFMNMLYKAYSPEETGMVAMSPGPHILSQLNKMQEAWIEGQALAIPGDMIAHVNAELRKIK